MSVAYDLEIHNLLSEYGDPALVADRLIRNMDESEENITASNVEALARFLWHCGFLTTLNDFVLRHIQKENFPIPWAYFAEAIGQMHPEIEPRILASLKEGIDATKGWEVLSRSAALDRFFKEVGALRRDRKYKIHKRYYAEKKNYIDQLTTLRTQQLYEQEKDLLELLQKLYPGDQDVHKEFKDHEQRYATEILARWGPSQKSRPVEEVSFDEDQLKILHEIFLTMEAECKDSESLGYDCAIAMWMMEDFEHALLLLGYADNCTSKDWLYLELLLKCRRFLELLQALVEVENVYVDDPETFFATTYLRAQAFWGLGQRHMAIEIMESLVTSRPNYRSAPSLLNLWRGQ